LPKPNLSPGAENCIPESIVLTEAFIGNVKRANRAEVSGLMNPPLTRYTDYFGNQLDEKEIEGDPDRTTPSGQPAPIYGLKHIMQVQSNTVKTWFGLRGGSFGNCVRRGDFLNSRGNPKTWTTERIDPTTGEVLTTVNTGAALSSSIITVATLRRVALAAGLVVEEGICRVDDDGEWLSAYAEPKSRKDRGTGAMVPMVWRDVYKVTTLERCVSMIERIITSAHPRPFVDKIGLDYHGSYLRIKIAEPSYGPYHEQDATNQGIRPGEGYELLTSNETAGWFVMIDRCFPIQGSVY